ncbi:MAG TPA: GMC family oxidoreductase N-terminal domain-containing protein [bacterium]|nr:GMC family oxidoreductase N-terminal domain-containing protein [bacterium]
MTFFRPYERRILQALCEALLPPTALLAETPADVDLISRVESHVAFCPPNIRSAFRLGLWLVEWGALLRRGARFTRLSEAERSVSMEGWKKSWIYGRRLLFKLLEANCLAVYYATPEISKKLGYEPPPVKNGKAAPIHVEASDRDLYVEADVCVVGSGAGGAVVAKELAEKGRKVVLIEEGAYYTSKDFGREAVEIVERIYHGGGTQTTVGLPCILLPTGRAVGGTTVINSGTCFRASDQVLEKWRTEFGLTGLTPEALAPYFDRVEKHLHVAPVTEETLGNNSKIFRRGLEAMGLKGFPLPRNADTCAGSGMCCFGCPTDAKQAVQLSYVPRAVEKGAKLFARCRVETVIPKLSHGGEVIGRFVDEEGRPGKRLHVSAHAVVLAAGTLKTPYLLRKNRIVLHNRHVGRHLNIHPTGKIIGVFDELVRAWEGVPQGYGYGGMKSDGILFEGAFTPPSLGAVNISLPAREHKEAMERYDHVASFGFLISDQSRGWIRWLPNGDPIIYYSIHRRELDRYVKGIRFLCEVYLAAGVKKIYTGLRPLPVVTPETGLKDFDKVSIKRTDMEISAFHPLGTCRMAADPERGVVDENGEVHGVKNLFIADGSIFPSSMGVNPQETIMAFANRIADFIDAKRL